MEITQKNDKPVIRYYDHHTIYARVEIATKEQIINIIHDAIYNMKNIVTSYSNCKFKVNLVKLKTGDSRGIAYIRITNKEVYNVLVGLNPDGSSRVEYYPDPLWTLPEKKLEDAIEELENSCDHVQWADLDELEQQYIHPMLERELSSLIEIPKFKYTEKQMEYLRKLYTENNIEGDVPEYGGIHISRAFVVDPDTKFNHNILCARNIPNWIDETILKDIFIPYVENIRNKYPIVSINTHNNIRTAFVTFDPYSNDALFALHMNKHLPIRSGNNKTVLYFSNSYKNEL
jgi:hypothetical protein